MVLALYRWLPRPATTNSGSLWRLPRRPPLLNLPRPDLVRHTSTGRARGRPKKSTLPTPSPLWFLLADVHISESTRPRLLPFFEYFFTEFHRLRPSHILFLGDTFHIRSATDPRDHRFLVNILLDILAAPWSPTVHLLVGNHDMKNKVDRTHNSLAPFELASPRVMVYAEKTVTEIDGRRVLFVPYHADEKVVREWLQENAETVKDSELFFHGSVNGAIMANSRRARHRLCTESPLDPGALGKAKQAFLGHFHKHGPVAGDDKVVYVGSPIQSNVGDAGDLDHGFVSYQPNTGEWELHRNPRAEYFLTTTLRDVEAIMDRVEGKVVQILLREGEDDSAEIAQAVQLLREAGAKKVEAMRPPPTKHAAEIASSTAHFEMRVEDMVEGYMESRLALEGADKELELERKEYFFELLKTLPQIQSRSDSPFIADFSRVIMHNFRGIRGTTVLDIAALPPGEVFLVSGRNGSGKSTMIEAVVWCLFGKFLSTNLSSEEISHRGTKETFVTIEFANGWSITRSRKGKRTKTVGFKVRKPNGEMVDEGHSAAATTEWWLKEVFGMGLSMFKQCCVIGDNAEYFTRAASDKERAAAMDELFGLEGVGEARDVLTERLKELEGEKTALERKLEMTELEQKTSRGQLQQVGKEIAEAVKEIAGSEAKVEGSQRRLREIADELEGLQAKREKYQEELRDCEEELREVRGAVFNEERALFEATERELQLRIDAIGEVLLEVAEKVGEARRRQKEEQEMLERERREQRRLMNVLREIFQRLTMPLFSLFGLAHGKTKSVAPEIPFPPPEETAPSQDQPQTEEVEDADSSLLPRLEALRTAQTTARTSLKTHLTSLTALCGRHHSLNTNLYQTGKRYYALKDQQAATNNALTYTAGSLSAVRSRLNTLQDTSVSLTNSLATLTETHATTVKHLSTTTRTHSHATFWLTELRDTERQKGRFLTHCRSLYISHLNSLLSSIIPSLSPDSPGLLSFRITPDLTIQPIGPEALALGERSRGQLTRTYLALFLAMFTVGRERLKCAPRCVWMDEVIDAMDDAGIEGLREWLGETAEREGVRAFLLTHREGSLGGRVVECVKGEEGEVEYLLR